MSEFGGHTAENDAPRGRIRFPKSVGNATVDLDAQTRDEPCRLGYEEYDGARYCFEHGGFLEPGIQSRRCNRAGLIPEMDLPGMWSQSDYTGSDTSVIPPERTEEPTP